MLAKNLPKRQAFWKIPLRICGYDFRLEIPYCWEAVYFFGDQGSPFGLFEMAVF